MTKVFGGVDDIFKEGASMFAQVFESFAVDGVSGMANTFGTLISEKAMEVFKIDRADIVDVVLDARNNARAALSNVNNPLLGNNNTGGGGNNTGGSGGGITPSACDSRKCCGGYKHGPYEGGSGERYI